MPVSVIFENLEAGMSVEEITEVFDVTAEEVKAGFALRLAEPGPGASALVAGGCSEVASGFSSAGHNLSWIRYGNKPLISGGSCNGSAFAAIAFHTL